MLGPILGILIGATLNYLFTKFLEDKKHRQNLRTQAYIDYMKCVCESAQSPGNYLPKEIRDIRIGLVDAKSRICLYGSRETIRTFSIFENYEAKLSSAEGKTAYVDMIVSMRRDSGNLLDIFTKTQSKEIELVLLGKPER
jgi:hypothetical protein